MPVASAASPDNGRNINSLTAATPSTSVRPVELEKLAKPAFELPGWAKVATKSLVAVGLAVVLALGSVGAAEAARSGGRAGGSRFSSYSSAPSMSRSAPSVSSYSRTTVIGGGLAAPSFFFPMGGYGYGYPMGYSTGPSFFSIIFFMILAAVLFQVVTGMMSGDDSGSFGGERVAVGKLQVALLGSARQLQKDLDRVASRADTSSAEGLSYLLQETVLALQRNPDYWVYGSSNVEFERSFDDAEGRFNEMSLGERSKFRQETLSNVDGFSDRKQFQQTKEGDTELIVVTLLVAADNPMKLPKISSSADMRTALNRIGSVPVDSIVAVEVLWTPQDPTDYYTKDEVMADYPELSIL